jgi:hypothetical protein
VAYIPTNKKAGVSPLRQCKNSKFLQVVDRAPVQNLEKFKGLAPQC